MGTSHIFESFHWFFAVKTSYVAVFAQEKIGPILFGYNKKAKNLFLIGPLY